MGLLRGPYREPGGPSHPTAPSRPPMQADLISARCPLGLEERGVGLAFAPTI